jgi:hypothetical protein
MERPVIDPSPAEYAVELVRHRALRDPHAGRVVSRCRRRVVLVEGESAEVRVRVEAAGVPLDEALEQRAGAVGLPTIAQPDCVERRESRLATPCCQFRPAPRFAGETG